MYSGSATVFPCAALFLAMELRWTLLCAIDRCRGQMRLFGAKMRIEKGGAERVRIFGNVRWAEGRVFAPWHHHAGQGVTNNRAYTGAGESPLEAEADCGADCPVTETAGSETGCWVKLTQHWAA